MVINSVIKLSDYITELEYPRHEFMDINRAKNNITITNIDYNMPIFVDSGYYDSNDYYIISYSHNSDIDGYTLVRRKDKQHKKITELVPTHLNSSVIKNILFNSYEKDLTNNMLLFILYYKVTYSTTNPLSNMQITEGVILEISNIIKLLIDKEHSTYKNESRVSEVITDLRKLLVRERIHLGIKPKLNLRR